MNNSGRTRFVIAEQNSGSMSGLALLRWSLVVIFIWFGCMKFTSYEAHGIAGLIANSPFMSWLHTLFGIEGGTRVVGVLELATAAALIAGAFVPVLSALGAAMSTATYVITLTFFVTHARRVRSFAWWLPRHFGRHRAVPAEGSGPAGRVGYAAARLSRTIVQMNAATRSRPGVRL